jgi:ATPase family associated with various cellular activities (AAA)
MTYYFRHGTKFNVSATAAMDIHETLPVGTYTVKFDQMSGTFYLEQIENFEVKGKIYGDTSKLVTRILATFADRPAQTGVMLSGSKGGGKTLLAKLTSLEAMETGIPTIVINEAWHGEGFNSFMQSIEQPTIVIFDEFEKVYDDEKQEQVLTLLDGVYPSKKLFIITCNDKYRVNSHMRNRPGRIFYRLDYSGLEENFIIEYCQDNLKAKNHIDTIVKMASIFNEFNFDMLKAMVEEMNRYGETPQEVMKVLNAKPEQEDNSRFKVRLKVGGKEIAASLLEREEWTGNPFTNDIHLPYNKPSAAADDDYDYAVVRFSHADLLKVDAGKFHFKKPSGDELFLTKKEATQYNYWDAF